MFFGLFQIANMLGPPKFASAIQRKDQKPSAGKPTALIILVIVMFVVVNGLMHGHASALWANLAIVVISGVIFTSMFATGATESAKKQNTLRKLPSTPPLGSQPMGGHSPSQMRERAVQLQRRPSMPATGGTKLLDRAPPAPPTIASPAPPAPHIVTRRQIREDTELDERLLRVAAILIVGCPLCGSEEAELCKPIAGRQWYQLDAERGLFAHAERIGFAVKARTAKIEDVTAQFDGAVPDPVWEAILS